jgi:putative transposase
MTNNIGLQPIIINGKGIKSINQYYNKKLAEMKSDLKKRNCKDWSNKIDKLNQKRFNRVKNFMHNSSRYIIDYCLINSIDTIVVGINKEWKQESKMSKQTNQKFVGIPYEMFISQLKYKCQDNNIKFIETEESYTSGTSFVDNEEPIKNNYDKSRRVTRGLFKSNNSILINADVNGAYQIMKKVFPEIEYGIEGRLTPVIINVTKFVA